MLEKIKDEVELAQIKIWIAFCLSFQNIDDIIQNKFHC
jgi:hypothetical protein